MCEWCSAPVAEPGALLCAACEEADAEIARAEVAAELAEARRVRAWQRRQMVPCGDGGAAEQPPF